MPKWFHCQTGNHKETASQTNTIRYHLMVHVRMLTEHAKKKMTLGQKQWVLAKPIKLLNPNPEDMLSMVELLDMIFCSQPQIYSWYMCQCKRQNYDERCMIHDF